MGVEAEHAAVRGLAAALFDFAAGPLGVPRERFPDVTGWAATGNTFGAVALRLGALDLDEIESIASEQEQRTGRFGEIGIRLGFLRPAEVRRVLEVQRLHRLFDIGALLVREGLVETPDLLDLLAEFLRREAEAGSEGAGAGPRPGAAQEASET